MSDATLTLESRDGRDFLRLPKLEAVLTAASGEQARAVLGLSPLVVGSGPESGLRIDDPSISRSHCELQLDPGGVLVRDLQSKNGTKAAGVMVREAVIGHAATLQLGKSRLSFQMADEMVVLPLSKNAAFGDAMGGSIAMRALFAQLERVSTTESPLLLTGESGAGKEVLANAVHNASPRQAGEFVVLDCASLSPTLAEAEVFGHVKGAFTGADTDREGLLERADGGTLFLDEVGELPLELQPRLLRALDGGEIRRVGGTESRRVSVRVVAATHRNLGTLMREGKFREDLYYRLAVVEVPVPALRDRHGDIPMLMDRFLGRATPPLTLSDLPPGTLEMFEKYDWPGNVRELKNACERLISFPELGTASVLRGKTGGTGVAPRGDNVQPWKNARDEAMESFEREYLSHALGVSKNVTDLARRMGVSRQLAHRLLARNGLRGDP